MNEEALRGCPVEVVEDRMLDADFGIVVNRDPSAEELAANQVLHERGYAVVYLSPDELADHDFDSVEDMISIAANEAVEEHKQEQTAELSPDL